MLDLKAGKIYTNSIGMQFRLIHAGSLVIGSPDGTGNSLYRPKWPAEPGRQPAEQQSIATLTKPFYMQTTEVTQGQWKKIMGTNPSHFAACGLDCPVEQISWDDAKIFIETLNTREGRTNCNSSPNICYSLPSEVMWEYAARAGTLSAFYNGPITNIGCNPLDANLDKIGWYCGNANGTTHPVSQKEPNNLGLYDMSGNVMEWCEDQFLLTYALDPTVDRLVTSVTPTARSIRNGSWSYNASASRSARRANLPQNFSSNTIGFRLVLAVDE